MLDQVANTTPKPHLFEPVRFTGVSLSIAGKKLVHDFTCEIGAAGKTVVLGPNGAGKSLFLRLLAGLVKPQGGDISGGVKHAKDSQESGWSLVFQNPVLLRRSTFANLAYVLKQQGWGKHQLTEKVEAALNQARLESCAQTPARNLSGGEKQRLALARALVVEPGALLLDEATASLDPASTHIVEQMVETASENGTKIFFVTHDIRQAKRLADNILFIDQGRILVHKNARDFFKEPGSEQAQAYLDGRVPDRQRQE